MAYQLDRRRKRFTEDAHRLGIVSFVYRHFVSLQMGKQCMCSFASVSVLSDQEKNTPCPMNQKDETWIVVRELKTEPFM
jgi:hypothetical protein